MAVKLYADNRQLLTVSSARNEQGTAIVGASITATLLKEIDDSVADANFDHLAMADVNGSPGDYNCVIAAGFSPPPGQKYYILYEATNFRMKQRAYVVTRISE